MAKPAREQRQQQVTQWAVGAALTAEAEDAKKRERYALWDREGTRLSWQEYASGEPCRGCGKPVSDGLGSWGPLAKLSASERAEYDAAEAAYRAQHSGCNANRWSVRGSRVNHCLSCCPPPPLDLLTLARLAALVDSWPSVAETKKDLDEWLLTLRCDHVVPFIQHRSNTCVITRVLDCPDCGERRGVIRSEHIGPAHTEPEIIKERAFDERRHLAQELAAAEARLERQDRTAAATRRRIQELREELNGDSLTPVQADRLPRPGFD